MTWGVREWPGGVREEGSPRVTGHNQSTGICTPPSNLKPRARAGTATAAREVACGAERRPSVNLEGGKRGWMWT
eukprot:2496502-Rhodomonas_salina.2